MSESRQRDPSTNSSPPETIRDHIPDYKQKFPYPPNEGAIAASPASTQNKSQLSPQVSLELERLQRIRKRTIKFKEDSERVFTLINKGEHLELVTFLQIEKDVKI